MKLVRMLAGMLVVAMLMCSGNLCISASKQDGKIPYSSTTVTLLIEVLKLAVMLAAIVITETPPPARFVPIEAFYYAVPSFLYTIDNNLNYVILRFMDAATLSVLWNLKIVVTAVLFRFVLKHPLSELRKIAIVLLVVGVLTSESTHVREMEDAMTKEGSSSGSGMGMQSEDDKSAQDLVIGVLLVLVGVTLSSCASVFTEWAFKRKSSCPFLWQNIQMYVFGIIFNVAGVLLVEGEEISSKGFFHGYNQWTLAVIAVNSIGGIGMGFILKYLDNIACVYSHSMAMMLTMLFSMLFFSFKPSLEFGCGLTVLIISMYIYHHPLAHHDARPPADVAKKCSDRHKSPTGSTDRNDKKRLAKLKQQELDIDDDDTDTSSIASSSGGSISSMAPRSMRGLQLKKTQYAMLPGESEDLESARANAKAMEMKSALHSNNQTRK
ncbi:CMP-sialic acid transporter 4 [Phytophthora citrophthora]|uniref:CMP-sialic acid transporter 4 n=1 Tax=Phytophthora citrophthora TaxID=4793 RepID=A0AAD9GNR2_9STRA|nr:CMP-sialic acid transporter 4 [Phytophthora citrophthora]